MTKFHYKLFMPFLALALVFLLSCEEKKPVQVVENYYETQFFHDAQMAHVFEDSKTFVDCLPKRSISEIVSDYNARNTSDFDMKTFVLENFEVPGSASSGFESDTSRSMSEHIVNLWPVLTKAPDAKNSNASLIPLPNSYVVPGGRFREVYYWDSYFTMLGLVKSDRELATNMVNNFAFLIDSLGFIPNGNRNYYSGRSQPPFFSLMVSLVASDDRDQFVGYLDALVNEYNFWMNGATSLNADNNAMTRVVMLPDSSVLNRFWDNFDRPRPESYREDYELVEHHGLEPSVAYRHLRAGAESGWDYSSRWYSDKKNMSTIHTTEIIPVDLNSLMYHLELMIAQGYNWSDDMENAQLYLDKAEDRKNAIMKYLWDEDAGFFVDYDFVAKEPTGVHSLAGMYPLFFQIATKDQASKVKLKIESDFLVGGGFVTTLNDTGEQWDYPNGWAPLQWITINGLYNYGEFDLGNEGASRWIEKNRKVYKSTGKMMEKYNVVDIDIVGGGGEYPNQDGFGWTNGVALSIEAILNEKKEMEEAMAQ